MSAIRKLIDDIRFELQSDVTPTMIIPIRLKALDAAEAELKDVLERLHTETQLHAEAILREAERDRADAELLKAVAEIGERHALERWAAAKGSGRVQTPKVVSCLCSGGRRNGCAVHPKGGGG